MSRLLDVKNLSVEFTTWQGRVQVLDNLSFSLDAGETLCIVGESGCGKSMTALALMGLVPQPDGHITAGQIILEGRDLLAADAPAMHEVRGNRMAMIFQEPMTSLNPVYTVGDQIAEVLRIHRGLSRKAAWERAIELLRQVRIPDAARRIQEYPHQFSGGMRQRVMIAMALACEPRVLIADEPTTALDVTVQAQIFNLLTELRLNHDMGIILITHDMGAVAEMGDRVLVMYAGRKVEEGRVHEVLDGPAHPYTDGLTACRPELTLGSSFERKPLAEIPGIVPPLHALPAGCAFEPRCPRAIADCSSKRPSIRELAPGRSAACWLAGSAK